MPKYTILKFHFNAVLSRAFSKTFKINQELEEYICVLFFPSLALRAESWEQTVFRIFAAERIEVVRRLTSHLSARLDFYLLDLRSEIFLQPSTCCSECWYWKLFSVRTIIFLNYRQDCKYFSSNLLFPFKQTARGNEAV